MYGPHYKCQDCFSYDLCFKCYRHIKICHYKGHNNFWRWNKPDVRTDGADEVRPEAEKKCETARGG